MHVIAVAGAMRRWYAHIETSRILLERVRALGNLNASAISILEAIVDVVDVKFALVGKDKRIFETSLMNLMVKHDL